MKPVMKEGVCSRCGGVPWDTPDRVECECGIDNRWHKVDTEPPPQNLYEAIVCNKYGVQWVDIWSDGSWVNASSHNITNITHWHPLPEPPPRAERWPERLTP